MTNNPSRYKQVEVRDIGTTEWHVHSYRLTTKTALALKADLERPFNGKVLREARIVTNTKGTFWQEHDKRQEAK